jgi:hypothetical protein
LGARAVSTIGHIEVTMPGKTRLSVSDLVRGILRYNNDGYLPTRTGGGCHLPSSADSFGQ